MAIAVGYNNGTRARSGNKPVTQYTKDGKFIQQHDSAHQASRTTGICRSLISECLNKKRGKVTAGGCTWKYSNLD